MPRAAKIHTKKGYQYKTFCWLVCRVSDHKYQGTRAPGRGPTLGPMVYGSAFCAVEDDEQKLRKMGFIHGLEAADGGEA